MLTYSDRLIEYLKSLPYDQTRLAKTDNPLMQEYLKRSIADRERLLEQLTTNERQIIERCVINGEKTTALVKDTGMTVKQIYNIKEYSVDKLCRLRYGAAYHP